MNKGFLHSILRSKQTVFTFKDLLLQWQGVDVGTAKKRVSYYVKSGSLYRIRKGIYAKDPLYDPLELATKIYTPAYISFETVLGAAGVTFQYYDQIFVASYQTHEITADGHKIVYKRLKRSILTNSMGIENRENYAIASVERAFLDTVYLHRDYHFDHLRPLNWDKVFEILSIYGNKAMATRVNHYYNGSQEQ